MAVNALARVTAKGANPRGDDVQTSLIKNPYLSGQDAVDFENGYEYAQSIGHVQLGQMPPDAIQHWKHSPKPWQYGFGTAATKMGLENISRQLLEKKQAMWATEYLQMKTAHTQIAIDKAYQNEFKNELLANQVSGGGRYATYLFQ
jgi:hypothetical protein